ncbi:hypothetical protein COEREDRAFT_85756 [Coemansia reversa NRRL 1564]|uniref:Uncharacterized protein n=1 Tax=Coemansia reversa (strain ATCC 12441 / NRRL 1564) TaxID=763665 RepID=A0A2G5BFW5_COERN|nr:hypothetical protein COEREDRAFT_85756 [Coemansia reversa NRRL 1564]|eukprot:PIA17872.1 hypothetical protein COEREDRAFT_85756 [Coemansia reversa NRRL 1564]
MATDLRRAFVDYCGAADCPEKREAAQIELTEQLDRLQQHCHSAHECAKGFPEIGPLLTTIAHSRAVARCSRLTGTVIDTAAAYSKIQNTGTYANQRAARWFSQVVEWLIAAANGSGHGRICKIPGYVVVADQVAGQRYALQQLVALMAEKRGTWDMAKRERVWDQAFMLCCGSQEARFFEYMLPALDDCGWARLESHRLIQDHAMELATMLPISATLRHRRGGCLAFYFWWHWQCRLWERLEAVRAQLILHLLSGGQKSAGVRRIFGAVLADEVLARQMLRDIACLVLATRDHRLVEMWKRIFRDSNFSGSRMLKNVSGPGAVYSSSQKMRVGLKDLYCASAHSQWMGPPGVNRAG